jgi:hypothetical protein
MSAAVSLAGSSAVEASLQGMTRSGQRMHAAAQDVLGASVSAMNASSTSTQDTVTLSDAALKLSGSTSMEKGLLDGKVAGLVYTANAKVVAGANEISGTLMNMVV